MSHMVGRVLRFIRLPLLLLVIFAVARFSLGAAGFPYAPRGNAMFSIVGLTFISSFYFGALSHKVGGLSCHIGTSYFRHWDALNVSAGAVVPMGTALATRAGGILVGPILAIVPALIGRALAALAPEPATSRSND
jgi:hypothetical protein